MDVAIGFSLTPEQARAVGTWALLLLVVLDLLASADEVPFNSPRDWLLWLTQWKSLSLWSARNRDLVRNAGRKWAPFVPLNYLPLTGAFVPFMCAVLIGHFFHPGLGPIVGSGGFVALGISLSSGLAVSVATYFVGRGRGANMVFSIVVGGLLCGVLVWPVSG